jgi:hypothetical protein
MQDGKTLAASAAFAVPGAAAMTVGWGRHYTVPPSSHLELKLATL